MKRILLFFGLLVLLLFVLFVVNQTAQVVGLAALVHPLLGRSVLLALLAAYAICLGVPALLFLKLPRPLVPPPDETSDAFRTYLEALATRLAANPCLKGTARSLDSRAGIEKALETLHEQAREKISSIAATVFMATAVSQSGRFDAFLVLVAQTRMIWQVAHVYWQRPSIRDLVRLYSNVAATVFLVQRIEDLDLTEQLEEILSPILAGSAVSAIPGFAAVAGFVVDSIVEGTVNAYLTLRVGCIASRYCGALTALDRRLLRRSATAEAGAMLPSVALPSAKTISRAVTEKAIRVAKAKAADLGRFFTSGAESVSAAMSDLAQKSGAAEVRRKLQGLAEDAVNAIAGAAKRGIGPFRRKVELPGAAGDAPA